jgi:adenosine deaminase
MPTANGQRQQKKEPSSSLHHRQKAQLPPEERGQRGRQGSDQKDCRMGDSAVFPHADDELYQALLRIPKVELHAHLNGCVRETTLFELAAARGVELPAAYFAAADTHNNDGILYNRQPRALADCFAIFGFIAAAVNDLPALRRITREALDDFAAHHVVYLELRSTPKQLWKDYRVATGGEEARASKRDYIETILAALTDFQAEEEARYARELLEYSSNGSKKGNGDNTPRLPLQCRFLVSVDRAQSVVAATEHVDLALELSQSQPTTVVGMDLGGNPTQQDFGLFAKVLDRARSSGRLGMSLHCAEIPCTDPNSRAYLEAASMLEFAPDRLGHALLLPPDLQARLLEARIPVESCPTSNVMTLELARHDGSHLTLREGLAQHVNLRSWLEAEHPVSLCTDDPGVFGTSLTTELWLVAHTFALDVPDLVRLEEASVAFAFCDAATRASVQAEMQRWHKETDTAAVDR